MPEPTYPLPIENLLSIKYIKNANHYWVFDKQKNKAVDEGASNTFLHEALKVRLDSGAPNDPIRDFFTDTVIFHTPLETSIPTSFTYSQGLDDTDSYSLLMGSNCLKLGDITSDHPYASQCLRSPELCDYGISVSVWVNFRDDGFGAQEILLGTGPLVNQGFQLYYQRGKLKVSVIGTTKKWYAEVPMEKIPDVWNIVGFTWYKDIGEISIYINSKLEKFGHGVTQSEYSAGSPEAISLFLGCSSDGGNDIDPTTFTKAWISHPAIWLWPIQRTVLLTGGLVRKFVKDEDNIVTTPPIVIKPPEFDYASVVDEYLGNAEPGNAFYYAASVYYDLQEVPSVFQGVNVDAATAITRNRKSLYLQTSDSYAKMKGNFWLQCAGKFNHCNNGVTYAVWVYIPSSFSSNDWSDLLEIRGNFRLSLYYQQLHIYIVTQHGNFFYQAAGIERNIWLNIAVTITSEVDIFHVYINGVRTQTIKRGFPPDVRNLRSGLLNGDVIIGSAEKSRSVKGAKLSDFIIWEQYLFPFAIHRVLGYTDAQLTAMTQSTHYWTTNPYILSDYNALNDWAPNKYKVRSMYKQKYRSFEKLLDQYDMTKSAVVLSPSVSTKNFDYFFLGHKKYRIPVEADISWRGKCFTDCTASTCRGNGISISLWIKILSVADKKIRFYLNTGDMGDAINRNDARGVSVYTRGKLFGISLSTKFKDWNIIIDSNRYKKDDWFNVGILWRYDLGLRLIMDGIDYGLINDIPESMYKSEDTHYRAVIGRFDDDKNNTWTENDIWEMAHFVFGDLTYFDSYKTPEEYARLVGLQTNIFYSTAQFYLRREQLINLPFVYLKEAKQHGRILGVNGIVNWITDNYNSGYPRINNGELILRYYSQSECPYKLDKCEEGISVSSWFYIHNFTLTGDYTLISFGESTDANSFALVITPERRLKAWIKIDKEKIVVTGNKVAPIRWTNFGFTWKKKHGLSLLINGDIDGSSAESTTEQGTDSAPKSIRLGNKKVQMPTIIDVYNFALYHEYFSGPQMESIVGIKYSKVQLLKHADYFWTFTGLYRRLEPFPLKENYVDYTQDRYENHKSAVCTRGTKGSYIEIAQTLSTCLQNSVSCDAFILSMNIKLLTINSNSFGYILSSGAQRSNQIGLAIKQNGINQIDVIVRSPNRTCTTNATLKNPEWIQLKLLWYSSKTPILKADGITIAEAIHGSCTSETNLPGVNYTSVVLGRANDDDPRATKVCLSDVSLMEFAVASEADVADKETTVSTFCYQNVDLSFNLFKSDVGPQGQPNTASKFSDLITSDTSDGCVSDPSMCENGLTVSIYVNIIDSPSMGYVLNTGESIDRGLVIKLKNSNADADFLDVFVVLNNGTAIWSVISSKSIKKNIWNNLAVAWSSDLGLLLYVNGIQKEVSTASNPINTGQTKMNTIYIGKKSEGEPILSGYVSSLVIWNKFIVTCNNPRLTHKALMGLCKENLAISTVPQCTSLGICVNGSGIVCLDKTEVNINRMGSQTLKITVPSEGINLLKVAVEVMESIPPTENITESVGMIFNNVAENMEIGENITSENVNNFTETILFAAETIFKNRYRENWNSLDKTGILSPGRVVTALESFGMRLAKKLDTKCSPVISQSKNIIGSLTKLDRSANCNSFMFPEQKSANDSYSAKDNFGGLTDIFQVPKEAFLSGSDEVHIAAFMFDPSLEIMPNTLSNETKLENGTETKFVVNSRLFTINISPKPSNPLPNGALVNFTFKLTVPNKLNLPKSKKFFDDAEMAEAPLKYAIKCGFWDPQIISSESLSEGTWDVSGCQIEAFNLTHVSCSCNHLTSFAILMQPIPPVHSTIHDFILSVITYIGIVLSLICLLIFIVIILFGKELCGDRYFIHLNLCIALFVAQLAFVLIETAKNDRIYCRAIAIVMHLFFIASFFWFFFESLFAFYAVTAGIIKGRIKYYFPIAWLAAILVVAVTAGLNVNAYGQNELCWLTFEGYYLWAFLGPILLLIFLTWLMCLIVVCNIGTPAIKTTHIVDSLRSHTKQTCVLLPLMMAAWILGVFMVIQYSIPLAYFFVLFNSFQGVWVFICFGLMNPEVRAVMCRKQNRPSTSRSAVGSLTDVDKVPSSHPDIRNQAPLPVYHPSGSKSSMSESSQSINSRRELLKDEMPEPVRRPKKKKVDKPIDQPIDYRPPGTPEYY